MTYKQLEQIMDESGRFYELVKIIFFKMIRTSISPFAELSCGRDIGWKCCSSRIAIVLSGTFPKQAVENAKHGKREKYRTNDKFSWLVPIIS